MVVSGMLVLRLRSELLSGRSLGLRVEVLNLSLTEDAATSVSIDP